MEKKITVFPITVFNTGLSKQRRRRKDFLCHILNEFSSSVVVFKLTFECKTMTINRKEITKTVEANVDLMLNRAKETKKNRINK